MVGNNIHQFILDQKDKNQMIFIWYTLNSFGNNKAKKAIHWVQKISLNSIKLC